MIPLLAPGAPERDGGGPAPLRKRDGEAAGNAFDGEVKGAARRAREATRDSAAKVGDGEPGETDADTDTVGEGEDAPPETPAPAARGLMDVLAALAGAGAASAGKAPAAPSEGTAVELPARAIRPAAGEGASEAMPSDATEIDVANVLLKAGSQAADDGDGASAAKARLKIAHQETHFEPTMREAVLVDAKSGGEAAPQRSAGEGLLQLLASRSAPKTRDEGNAKAGATPAGGTALGASAKAGLSDDDAAAVDVPATPVDARAPRDAARERPLPANAATAAAAERLAAARDADASRSGAPAPVLPGSANAAPIAPIAAQLADRVVDAFFGAPGAPRAESPSLEAHLRLRAGGGVLKTLTIELQPEHLGTLTVSMRLKDGELAIEMAASRAETARLLSDDRTMLKTLLEKAGFSLDEAAITVSTRDAGASQPTQPQGGNGGSDGSSAGSGRGMGGNGSELAGGRGREERGSAGTGQAARGGADASDAPRGEGGRASGSVFL